MKKSAAILILWIVSATTWAQTTPQQEQVVLDLSKKKFDWLIGKNYDSLAALLDEKIKYVHSSGWVEDKKDVIDDLKTGKLSYQKVTVKEAEARLYPNAAIVNGQGTFEGATDGKSFTIELRYTEVYIKSGNRWKLASRHANRMP